MSVNWKYLANTITNVVATYVVCIEPDGPLTWHAIGPQNVAAATTPANAPEQAVPNRPPPTVLATTSEARFVEDV